MNKKSGRVVVAIDGFCASGKTTLAANIQNCFGGSVVHSDSFFLPPQLRTPERLAQPGGNFDRERFQREVVCGIAGKTEFSYGVFDCSVGRITRTEAIDEKKLLVIEGSYCMHPLLTADYDMKIFTLTDISTQLNRIKEREGKAAVKTFVEKWIPFELQYERHFQIKKCCDIVIIT